MFFVIISLLFIIAFPLFVKWYLRERKFMKIIEKIPGPRYIPIIGTTWIFWGASRKGIFKEFIETTKKYPNIFRLWMGSDPEVRLTKAEHIEKILSTTDHLEKSQGYEYLTWIGQGLLTSKGEKWHKHRKIITPTFHFSILQNFCEIFSEKSDILIERFKPHVGTGKAINIYPFIAKAALDVICDAAMGTRINAQTDEENDYVKAINDMSELVIWRILNPLVYPDFIYRLTKNGKRYYKCENIVHAFTNKVIQERKLSRKNNTQSPILEEGKRKRLAFLDLLLEANEQGNSLTDLDIREEVDTFMFEGHDTTASGISWALYLIGQNEEIQDKIVEEFEDIFQGSKRHATLQDLNDMKYLDRVIKECLRLYPPVSFIGRFLSKDITLDGYEIPKGCMVAIQIYNLHRDEKYFPDPEKFDPDRFLPENTVNRHPYAYLPFSAGPRNCIGQKFAILEQKAAISSILRAMKIKSTQKLEEMEIVSELILRPLNGIHLLFEERKI